MGYPPVQKKWKDVGPGMLEECTRRLAARQGHLPLLQELLKPLKKSKSESTKGVFFDVANDAAKGGHLEILQWLKAQKRFKLDSSFVFSACDGGYFEMLKWLSSEGCPWSEFACSFAAYGGHLEILKWLRSEGCPWDEETCEWAAEEGHLEVLKWLRSE